MRVWLAALPPFSHKLKICGSPIAQGGLQEETRLRVWLAALPPFSHKLKICGSPIVQGGLQDFSLHTRIVFGVINKQSTTSSL